MYSWVHWDSIDELYNEYKNMCEGGWDVKIIILTAVPTWSERTIKWSKRNLHCYRNNIGITLEVKTFNASVGRRIVDHSRIAISQHINDFDVFGYLEDDMILTYHLLTTWTVESNRLAVLTEGKSITDQKRCGWKHPCTFTIGFIRYSRKNKYLKNNHNNNGDQFRTNQVNWNNERYVTNKNRLEEEPTLDPFCIENSPYISIQDSSHQAMWLFTRSDILNMNTTCEFLTQFYEPDWKNAGMVREYMSSLSIYRNTWYI